MPFSVQIRAEEVFSSGADAQAAGLAQDEDELSLPSEAELWVYAQYCVTALGKDVGIVAAMLR